MENVYSIQYSIALNVILIIVNALNAFHPIILVLIIYNALVNVLKVKKYNNNNFV